MASLGKTFLKTHTTLIDRHHIQQVDFFSRSQFASDGGELLPQNRNVECIGGRSKRCFLAGKLINFSKWKDCGQKDDIH